MTLSELLALLRRRFVFVAALMLVAFAAACAYAYTLPNEYTATATMYVLQRGEVGDDQQSQESTSNQVGSGEITASDLNLGGIIGEDMSTIITSSLVEDTAAERLGLYDLEDFDISVASSTSSRIITLTVTGKDPKQTADVANELVSVTSDVAVDIMSVQSVNAIDPAKVPKAPSGPRRKLYAALGLMGGFCVALFLVVVADLLDNRVRSDEDVESVVSTPVLGRFPVIDSSDENFVVNAAKTLLANIRFLAVDEPVRTIAVTSAAPNEGKTLVASQLAYAIATSGKTVLLVEGDMRRRSLASRLGVNAEHGVYAVLAEWVGLYDAIEETSIPNMYFLDCEASVPMPSDLIDSQRYMDLIYEAEAMFDYVVFDTPPIGAFVDAAVLGSKVDTVLLVVRENQTRKPDLQIAVDQLIQSGSNVAGVVMNYCKTGSGNYNNYYYYGYYYSNDGHSGRGRHFSAED